MRNKYSECAEYINNFMNNRDDEEIKKAITDFSNPTKVYEGIRYLLAKEYIEGYDACRARSEYVMSDDKVVVQEAI